jgi:hypothetical protein
MFYRFNSLVYRIHITYTSQPTNHVNGGGTLRHIVSRPTIEAWENAQSHSPN